MVAFAVTLSVISPSTLYAGEIVGVEMTPYTIARSGGVSKNFSPGIASSAIVSLFKKYITTALLDIRSVKAQSSALDTQDNGVGFFDRFSLFLFCSIASPVNKSNCDYDTVAKTIPAPPGTILNGNGNSTNLQNDLPIISGLPVSPTAESSSHTPSSGITSPTPIITYINRYIPVPGPKGEDGRDGKDAQSVTSESHPLNNADMPYGYGSYVPSYSSPSSSIGVSTIGYLLQTIIEKPSISDGLFTGTNVFSNSLVANMITASSTTLSSASITSLSAGSATTTDLYVSQLIASSSTLASLVATNSTTTNAYIASLVSGSSTINNLFVSNSFSVQGAVSFATTTITDLTATRGVITNATTTNLFTQNLAVGNASTTGNQSIAGMFNVTGTSTLGANVYLNGSVTIGTSSNATLTINSLVNSNITPAANKIYDLGSPSFYWRDIYSDNINVNTLSAASTTISGTSNNTFSVNSDNGSTDGEDSSLVFFRGLVTPNALFRWNATTKRLESNMSFKVQNETPSTGTTTLTVQGGAGQGTTNLFELVNNGGQKLSVFNQTGWLGIGSTTPGSPLTVVGNSYLGGNVTATGTLAVTGTSTLATTTISQATITNASTTNVSVSGTLYTAIISGLINLSTTGTTTLATGGGNVGIGTTNPSTLLEISNQTADPFLTINGRNLSGASQGILFKHGTSTANAGYIGSITTAGGGSGSLVFSTGTASVGEVLRIANTGNVGIGTTTPSAKLDVWGNLSVGTSSSPTLFVNTAIGNVGIGVTAGTRTLEVAGSGRFFAAGQGDVTITHSSLVSSITSAASVQLALGAGGNEALRISTSGNIGIGTTTPETALTVRGASAVLTTDPNVLTARFGAGAAGSSVGVGLGSYTGGYGTIQGLQFTSNAGSYLYINPAGGNVGIGSASGLGSAQNTLSVSGATSIGSGYWTNAAPTNGLIVQGNVGIGTTTPSAKLTVSPFQSNIGTLTNNATGLIVGNPTLLGSATSSYLYSVETQSNAANVIRLQTSLYRRIAGADWNGTAYRLQYAVDNSFTDGSKAYMEIGGSDPSTVGGGFISFGTNGLDRLSINNTGNVGIGTTTPLNKLTIQSANGVAQIGVAYDTTRFTSLQTDAIGNLNISTSNGNAVFGNDNLKVCQGGACPTAVATSTAGNLFVENAVIIGDGFSARQVSTTELGLYNASGTLMVIFDNGI